MCPKCSRPITCSHLSIYFHNTPQNVILKNVTTRGDEGEPKSPKSKPPTMLSTSKDHIQLQFIFSTPSPLSPSLALLLITLRFSPSKVASFDVVTNQVYMGLCTLQGAFTERTPWERAFTNGIPWERALGNGTPCQAWHRVMHPNAGWAGC